MLFSSLLGSLRPTSPRTLRRRSASPKRPTRTRLQVERLESRKLLSANIDVSNLPQIQEETTIDINPVNPLNLVAASNSPNDAKPESEAVSAYFSKDGGNTWTTTSLPTKFQGKQFKFNNDPYVAFDSRGNVYVIYNAVPESPNQLEGATAVAKSTDGGETFTLVSLLPNFNATSDHARLAIDKNPNSPFRDTLYATWFNQGSAFGPPFVHLQASYSRDGGLTWSPPADVGDPSSAFGNALTVGPDGTVYATRIGAINPSGGATQLMNRSTDGGLTYTADLAVTTLNTNDLNLGTGFSSPAQPSRIIPGVSIIVAQAGIDTDRSAGPFRGRVYLAYVDRPDPVARPFYTDVYLQFSDNGGQTWSPRIRVNDDAPGDSHFFPNLSVDPADGTVVISWYDTRRDPVNLQKTDVFLAVGTPTAHGVSFQPNLRVTDAQSDESANNSHAQGSYGDYEGLVAFGGVAHPVWCDARPSNFPTQGGRREEVYTAAIQYLAGASLLATSFGHNGPTASLTSQQLATLLPEAIQPWQAVGVDSSALIGLDVRIADLGGTTLDLAAEQHRHRPDPARRLACAPGMR
jgi:hypothetical protein